MYVIYSEFFLNVLSFPCSFAFRNLFCSLESSSDYLCLHISFDALSPLLSYLTFYSYFVSFSCYPLTLTYSLYLKKMKLLSFLLTLLLSFLGFTLYVYQRITYSIQHTTYYSTILSSLVLALLRSIIEYLKCTPVVFFPEVYQSYLG